MESIKSRVRSEGYDNVQTVWADVEAVGNIPIPEKSLDVCFFVNVLSKLKKRKEALEEAMRLLKENGLLVIVDWIKPLGTLGPSADMMVKTNDVKEIAQNLNLKLVEQCTGGEYHFCLILKKEL